MHQRQCLSRKIASPFHSATPQRFTRVGTGNILHFVTLAKTAAEFCDRVPFFGTGVAPSHLDNSDSSGFVLMGNDDAPRFGIATRISVRYATPRYWNQ